ncbi:hypothetical protein CTEN210_13966 [Chaetoceros tenuissimus]|uniref:Flavin reductase like domain-containing protein n=1 Tax=Chaetoceros tenuissimus TaxID=426638 RepID=A0AAD3D6K8_9STRA|nr:hypothetical protein CTEN210_13966 [Chaetoceros tenuissimus]
MSTEILMSLLKFKSYKCQSLQITSVPPLIDVPTYSLATLDGQGKTCMNILTYATPVSVRPDRVWSIGIFKGTQTHENFSKSKRGILQLLAPRQSKVVRLLGGSSGKDVDKCEECKKLGFPWIILDGEEVEGEEEMPLVLPDCVYYLELTLIGDEANEDEIQQVPYLNTASLREMGIITSAGRVADLDE